MPGRRSIVVLLLCVPLLACFVEPVREHLHLTLGGAGPVIVTVVQEVADPELAGDNAALADRMEASRADLESSLDQWSRRFALLQPLAERRTVEHIGGSLRRSVQSAVLESFDDAVRLIEADGLTGNLVVSGGVAELRLYPTGGSRATYAQQKAVERRLAAWSEGLAIYFENVIDLYAYLESRPERAVSCFAHIFDNHEHGEAAGPLQPQEAELVRSVKGSVDRVVEALMVPDGESYSVNELARLVYDPFPARLTIAVRGEALDFEGLTDEGQYFERPSVDAWNALASLEGRWLSPDLVMATASPAPEDQQPDPDPVAFSTLSRFATSPPTAEEVESALLGALVPEEEVTLRWRPHVASDEDEPEGQESWLAAVTEAESLISE